MVCKMTSEGVVSPGVDTDTLDLSNQQMEKLTRATPELILDTTTLILDNNLLTRLDNIHTYQCLEKLSVSNNRLVRMFQISKLQNLKVLDLSGNSLVTIEGLKDIKPLSWLSLSSNHIRNIENLNQNTQLEHLDLSGNQITYVSNIAGLKNLKTLMLHDNKIGTLRSFSEFVPNSVTTLTLSGNQLLELVDVSHLAHMTRLEQLTLANNPCILQPQDIQQQFDYRPYVINWCLSLRLLDGVSVGAKESLKAEWMYSQSKGRTFGPGEQDGLLEYLVQTCPLDPTQETEQDRKLNLILSKVQEHQSSLRHTKPSEGFATLPRSTSAENKKNSAPSTPRRNSGGTGPPASPFTPGACSSSSPCSASTTPVNTPGVSRRNSGGPRSLSRYTSRASRNTPSPTSSLRRLHTPSQYNLELPPTLYGEDLVNGNDLMTQSMDPAFLSSNLLDNNTSSSDPGVMSQSVDANMLRENLNERLNQSNGPVRPRTLFSSRGSTDSGIRSDDQLEVVDVSDSESVGGLLPPVYSRLQSRLNPVPESLNSPDIVPGPSPPRRDDPLHSGPLSSLPHELELRLRNGNNHTKTEEQTPTSTPQASPRSIGTQPSPRPSDLMVAAVTARIAATPKTPSHTVVTRPTSAVKPLNITSKVDSGLSRSAGGRLPVPRARSQSAGPVRKNSLPNRQVAALRSGSNSSVPTPEVSRKRVQAHPLALADDEASDTETEQRNSNENQGKSRTRKQEMSSSLHSATSRGRNINNRRSCSPARDSSSPAATWRQGGGNWRQGGGNWRQGGSNGRQVGGTGSGSAPPPAWNRNNPRAGAGGPGGGTISSSGVETRPQPSTNTADRGWKTGVGSARNLNDQMTKSVSSTHVAPCSRPRSTSLTRSQSARLGKGGLGGGVGGGTDRSTSRPRSSTLSSGSTTRVPEPNTAARNIQAGWRGHLTRNKDPQVRDVKEELRNMRLEAHIKQLSKELRSARAALDQERKLRKVQSDTIKVLWNEIQSFQMEEDYDYVHMESLTRHDLHKGLSKKSQQRQERKQLGRFLATGTAGGGGRQEDSDSSRGEDQPGGSRNPLQGDSGSSTSGGVDERSVADLSRTCSTLQCQVEMLQASLASVVRYVSTSNTTRSRHSSSSQSTPPPPLPNSMTMSLPPSLSLPPPVTISRSCDSLAQTDIVAVKTPQTEGYPFLKSRQVFTDVDTSDSDLTRLDVENTISPPRARSPRPLTLPGVGAELGPLKRAPPPGSHIPGMVTQEVESPPGPRIVRNFANSLVEGIIFQTKSQVCSTTATTEDNLTDLSMSLDTMERSEGQSDLSLGTASASAAADSAVMAGGEDVQEEEVAGEDGSPPTTVDTDSLEKSPGGNNQTTSSSSTVDTS